jgi:ElaA protein
MFMEWKCLGFNSLTTIDLYQILKLRSEVFVVEQECIYNDLDDLDQQAIHIIGMKEEKLVAYARILPSGTRFPKVSIGRVVIHPNYRSKGTGTELMNVSIAYAKKQWSPSVISISAQQHLQKFYGTIGFNTVSDMYLEDGIPHVKMELELP